MYKYPYFDIYTNNIAMMQLWVMLYMYTGNKMSYLIAILGNSIYVLN